MSCLAVVFLTALRCADSSADAIFVEPEFSTDSVAGVAIPFGTGGGPSLVALADGRLVCAWLSQTAGVEVARLAPGATEWSAPVAVSGSASRPRLCPVEGQGLWLLFAGGEDRAAQFIGLRKSSDAGVTWGEPTLLTQHPGLIPAGKPLALAGGRVRIPVLDTVKKSLHVLSTDDGGTTWILSEPVGLEGAALDSSVVLVHEGDRLALYAPTAAKRYRLWKSVSPDLGKTWEKGFEIEVPNDGARIDALELLDYKVLLALNPAPEDKQARLSLWLSHDGGQRWTVFRDVEREGQNRAPALARTPDGRIHLVYVKADGALHHASFNETWVWQDGLIRRPYYLANNLPPLRDEDDERGLKAPVRAEPVRAGEFEEHVRARMTAEEQAEAEKPFPKLSDMGGFVFDPPVDLALVTSVAEGGKTRYIGTRKGLYSGPVGESRVVRHEDYGVDGPLSSRINALAFDSKGTLWIGTPLGLTLLKPDGAWSYIRGKQGLPVEDVTAIAIDERDRIWLGTSRGAIHYRPYESGRQWFYRAGHRYLLGDQISAVALAPGGMPAYFMTDNGISRIDAVTRTLDGKAELLEARLNQFHRRLGLVAACTLDDAENPTSSIIIDDDNDGLWTSYHVVAMSLAYGATGNEAYRESAMKGMHALVMLQNASGTPGLVARSVLPPEEGLKKREQMKDARRRDQREQWQPTPDGSMYWKSDTSSDEIDGHYFAFYAYWRHVAQFIPEERALIEKQVRDVTDYIIGNSYVLMDWDGERTTWGYWSPEIVNGDPNHYGDNGLNSLEILSFLKTAHYITGDPKYKEHYEKLICDHHYLSNVLLEKKVFPDSNNHSDNQLGYVAWYPILQLEQDPKVREMLQRSVRRHYKIIAPEKSSFFMFVTATIDPNYVDLEAAVENLKEISTDRRLWTMVNSHRADVIFQDRPNRHGDLILTRVLPADERNWNRWNTDPFVPDGGGRINQRVAGSPLSPHNVRDFGPDLSGEGRVEDDGGSFLLSYWLARYHKFVEG
ncbi:MAG: exo-alpha-sialidase [Candidatus Hydrogenedentes bacterium]|nr:exo-alpha-sialidase [Candidatus Hydrogenedentota bacterium]